MKQFCLFVVYLLSVALVSVVVVIFSSPTEPNHLSLWLYGILGLLISVSLLVILFVAENIGKLKIDLTFFQSLVQTQFISSHPNEELMEAFLLRGLHEPATIIPFFKSLPSDPQKKYSVFSQK